MKPNERNTIVGLLVFILVLLVVTGGIFNDISFSVSGKAIDKIKSKYFVFEEKAVDKLQNFENNLEKDADEFYQDVDDVEEEIVKGFGGFAERYSVAIDEEAGEIIEEIVEEMIEEKRQELEKVLTEEQIKEVFEEVENISEIENFEEVPEIICYENYYNCNDFNFTYEAFVVFEVCGGLESDVHVLDKNNNGVPCDELE